jgi:hypothetical protein
MSIYNMLVGSGSSALYSNKRRSLVMIGASVVWGDGLDTMDTYAYKMQQAVDNRLGTSQPNWPARFFHVDDMENGAAVTTLTGPTGLEVPFNGFGSVHGYGAGYNTPVAPSGGSVYRFNPLVSTTGSYTSDSVGRAKLSYDPYTSAGRPSTVADGPFAGYGVNPPNSAYKAAGLNQQYKDPMIRLQASGHDIRFGLKVPASGGLLYLMVKGVGSIAIFGATATFAAGPAGAATFNTWTLQTPPAGSNPANATTTSAGGGVGLIQSINHANACLYVFPLNAIVGSDTAPQGMSINWNSGYVDIVSMWVAGATPPTNHIGVQVCARNSYCLQDYYVLDGTNYLGTNQPTTYPQGRLNDIMRGVIYNTNPAVSSAARVAECDPPYYVLGDTYNSMVTGAIETFPDRRLAPAEYVKYIEGMGNYLSSSSAVCPGVPIVVMPIKINIDDARLTLLPGVTWENYRDALGSLAVQKGWRFVDQSALNSLNSGVPGYSNGYVKDGLATGSYPTTFYQVDGLHPTPTGTTTIANKYISDLIL